MKAAATVKTCWFIVISSAGGTEKFITPLKISMDMHLCLPL